MIFNKLRKAFSLTELLIVVVVIAVLFSAMLPIMTKRRNGATSGNEPVWQFVSGEQRDAFYDRNVPNLRTAAYFGVNPGDITSGATDYLSKAVIKANAKQHHIQFRYGNANGSLTGLFVMDDKGNTLGTGKLLGDSGENSNSIISKSTNSNNTVLGKGVFARVKNVSTLTSEGVTYGGVTSVGANSSMGKSSNSTIHSSTVAIGASANQYGNSANSVVVGSAAAKTEVRSVSDTTALGFGVLGLPDSSASDAVMAGPDAAALGSYSSGDVILGSNYVGDRSDHSGYNTIVGYGAYSNGPAKSSYITAVGYQACDSLGPESNSDTARKNATPSKKTCIGASSGGTFGPSSNSTKNIGWENDDLDHIFLGGAPQHQSVGGRSALEIHNIARKANVNSNEGYMAKSASYIHPGGAKPDMAPTVVMNSNLVVRGNVYWPTLDGNLRSHSLMMASPSGDTEKGADRCDRKCWSRFGRKYWRSGQCGSLWHDLFNTLGTIGSVLLVSAFNILVVGGVGGAVVCSILAVDAMKGANGERPVDPVAVNIIANSYDNSGNNVCAYGQGSTLQNYPRNTGGDYHFHGCPDLKLSDARLKENISENKAAIEKLLLIMPYNYTFKADKNAKPQVGVIAQDLQKYFPESVAKDNKGYMNIRLDEMFFASINTLKNLDSIVLNIENDVAVLESDADKLSNEHKSINKKINNMNNRLNKLEK